MEMRKELVSQASVPGGDVTLTGIPLILDVGNLVGSGIRVSKIVKALFWLCHCVSPYTVFLNAWGAAFTVVAVRCEVLTAFMWLRLKPRVLRTLNAAAPLTIAAEIADPATSGLSPGSLAGSRPEVAADPTFC